MSALDAAIEAAMETPSWEVLINLALFGLVVTAWVYPLVVLAWLVCQVIAIVKERL
jgi:hypothetical protein